jgi:hypothetical protein
VQVVAHRAKQVERQWRSTALRPRQRHR